MVDVDARLRDQAHQALTWAESQGWLTFEHVVGRPAVQRYVIVTAGRRRWLSAAEVLVYVTALADAQQLGAALPARWFAEPTESEAP